MEVVMKWKPKELKELMGDATRGDGRRLIRKGYTHTQLFEPIFKDADDNWHGLDEDGCAVYFYESEGGWQKYVDPKPKVEIVLRRGKA